MVIVIAVLLSVSLLAAIASYGSFVAWRRERRRGRLLAERLVVEGRLERLTAQTLQAMRQASRDYLNQRGR